MNVSDYPHPLSDNLIPWDALMFAIPPRQIYEDIRPRIKGWDMLVLPTPALACWLPFFEQLVQQLKKHMRKQGVKNAAQYDHYILVESVEYEGTPYEECYQDYLCPGAYTYIIKTAYRNKFLHLTHGDYAYGCFDFNPKHGGKYCDIWVRWRSHLLEHEYIHPDDGLNLTKDDITFEICTALPDEILRQVNEKKVNAHQPVTDVDCNAWIAVTTAAQNEPPIKKPSGKPVKFPFEITSDCGYPDTTFTFRFTELITDDLYKALLLSMEVFQKYWELLHPDTSIHDITDGAALFGQKDENTIQMQVDFGNCDPKVIKELIKWLQKAGLPIESVMAS